MWALRVPARGDYMTLEPRVNSDDLSTSIHRDLPQAR